MSQLLFILGREPELSTAELRSVFPLAQFSPADPRTLLAEGLKIDEVDLHKIGGIVKVGEVFAKLPRFDPKIAANFIAEKSAQKSGKLIFGASCLGTRPGTLKTLLIGIKKELRIRDLASRFVNKNFENLTSAQAELNGLTKIGTEILVTTDGKQWWYAETKVIQPFAEYKKRDYEKPDRDARIGMLPPKLAQIMINLGTGAIARLENSEIASLPTANRNDKPTVYDPFCGTGTILVEAALLGHPVIGSDLNPQMIEATKKNLTALNLSGEVFVHDATVSNVKYKTLPADKQVQNAKFAVVTEGYLGPPASRIPDEQIRSRFFAKLAELYGKFFGWIEADVIVLALPVYCEHGVTRFFASSKVTPIIEKLGWQKISLSKKRLIYARPDQTVGREITVWRK